MKKKPIKEFKKETVEEFLARGGEINKVPYKEPEFKARPIPLASKVPEQMDLTKGELFFAEDTRKKKSWIDKAKSFSELNMVPEDLLKKLGL